VASELLAVRRAGAAQDQQIATFTKLQIPALQKVICDVLEAFGADTSNYVLYLLLGRCRKATKSRNQRVTSSLELQGGVGTGTEEVNGWKPPLAKVAI
jgi:hypothetical protein